MSSEALKCMSECEQEMTEILRIHMDRVEKFLYSEPIEAFPIIKAYMHFAIAYKMASEELE